jgi:hypothetical protein
MSSVWPGPRDVAAYCPPVTYPPQSPASERDLIDEAIEDRRESGLPTDRDSIHRAVENSRRADYEMPGRFLTPDEQADAEAFDRRLPEYAENVLSDAGAEIGWSAYCWRGGRRMIEITVKHDVEHYFELLLGELHPAHRGRVILSPARHSERGLTVLSERIWDERDELRALGIDLAGCSHQHDALSIRFFSPDHERAERALAERYGPIVITEWLGPEPIAEEPCPFGSWIGEGRRLTVFYALPHNRERPGRCTASERPDRVIVALMILVPRGPRTLADGFRRSHATLQLAAPVGERIVIDAAENVQRLRWTGTSP